MNYRNLTTTLSALALFCFTAVNNTAWGQIAPPPPTDFEPLVVECDSCTEFGASSAAISATGISLQPQHVYVFDLATPILRHYMVLTSTQSGITEKTAAPLSVISEDQETFDAAAQYVDEGSTTEDFNAHSGVVGGIDTAYDLIGNGQNQRTVGDAIYDYEFNRGSEVFRLLTGYSALANMLAGSDRVQDTQFTIEVNFDDGSFVEFEVVMKPRADESPDIEYHYVEGSAVDSDGNPIPEQPGDLQFTAGELGSSNASHFIDLAQRFGFSFSMPGGAPSQGDQCSFSCDADKCTLTCSAP